MIKFEVDRNLKTFQLLEVPAGSSKLEIEIDLKETIGNFKRIKLDVSKDSIWFIYKHTKLGQIGTKFSIDEMVNLDLVFDDMITVIDRCCFLNNIISLCFVTSRPRVTFKVKSLENDSYVILELDYDDTAELNIEIGGYHFKLTDVGLEVTSPSRITNTTSAIMKDRNLVPLSGILKHAIVVECSELRRFINMLNTAQSDVMFEIETVEEININEE